jgi:hypothetical protein
MCSTATFAVLSSRADLFRQIAPDPAISDTPRPLFWGAQSGTSLLALHLRRGDCDLGVSGRRVLSCVSLRTVFWLFECAILVKRPVWMGYGLLTRSLHRAEAQVNAVVGGHLWQEFRVVAGEE